MINKIRPLSEVDLSFGNDGRDCKWVIRYYCPTCKRRIFGGYKADNACDNCGTFYDWGKREPRIKEIRLVDWGDEE